MCRRTVSIGVFQVDVLDGCRNGRPTLLIGAGSDSQVTAGGSVSELRSTTAMPSPFNPVIATILLSFPFETSARKLGESVIGSATRERNMPVIASNTSIA